MTVFVMVVSKVCMVMRLQGSCLMFAYLSLFLMLVVTEVTLRA